MNLSKLLSFEQGRITFFETLTKHPENWQQNPTPLSIVRKMLDKTSLENKKILVIFNIEFLQVLIEERKINPENIYYIADNELEYLSGIKIFKVQSYKLDEFSVPALKKLISGIDMKFDLVFSNPPYNDGIDIKILNEVCNISNEIIAVHPSTWIMDIKGKKILYSSFIEKNYKNAKGLEFFNGNGIFDIKLFLPCMITHLDKRFNGETEVSWFGNIYKTESIKDVTKYGLEWNTKVKSFYNTLQNFISQNSHMLSHATKERHDKSLFYVQLADIIGNHSSNPDKLLKDDFYTFVMKDSDKNLGIRKENISNTFAFNSQEEQNNFINYLKTDFARFCLTLFKNNANLHRGELEIVPWLDFTQEWDDDKLFAKFNVSQDLQDYIREFLPDYYGIRK